MKFTLSEVEQSWRPFFAPHCDAINELLLQIPPSQVAPPRKHIFRAFQDPIESVRVVIMGQDPYPVAGDANGLAFSVNQGIKIPASLRNIFKEYCSDLSLPTPTSGDLTPWSKAGVLLLNRTLTTEIGSRNLHLKSVWQELTGDIAEELGSRGVIAILWGSNAQELSKFFAESVQSPHPSPLSAYRGFFGSRPFSGVNHILKEEGRAEIDWRLL